VAGPGMQENALSDELLEIQGSRQSLRTDHRWPLLRGPPRAYPIGHVFAGGQAEGGLIALIEDGDRIEIDIPIVPSIWQCRGGFDRTPGSPANQRRRLSGSLDFRSRNVFVRFRSLCCVHHPAACALAPFGTSAQRR